MFCCCKRSKIDTIKGLEDVRKQSKSVMRRNWETRNKFRCMFCGGKSCKHENWTLHKNPAIIGLNSDWITDNILATQRLSSRIIKEHNIIGQFKAQNITSVFNLQLPGEHPYCGDGLQATKAFSYTPEELYDSNLYFYNIGWPDMQVPDLSKIVNLVQFMGSHIEKNEKVAVHCHAGYGRTGIAIACYILYSTYLTPDQTIALIRSKRPRCIQTNKQQLFVNEFYNYLVSVRKVFPDSGCSLIEYYSNQTVLTHGNDLKTIDSVPKIVYEVCTKVLRSLQAGEYHADHVAAAFYNPEKPVFTSPFYFHLLGLVQHQDFVVSVDETALNTPVITSEQINLKIKSYKHQLNNWDWKDFKKEKDVRVLVLLMIEWIEMYLTTPVIYDLSCLDYLESWADNGDFKFCADMKSFVNKVSFKLIEKIVSCILYPLLGARDYELVMARVIIALLGVKSRWANYFEGNKMKKIAFKQEDEYENKLFKVLSKWSEHLKANNS